MSRTLLALFALLALGNAAVVPSAAASYPAGFVEDVITSSVSSPTAFAFAPDGRIFVCQKGPGTASGTTSLRVIKNGALLATPFLSVTVDSQGERGLLGVAFDPQFTTNRYVYVYYTTPTPSPHNRIVRYQADSVNPDVAMAASATPILELDNLSSATNHNGGAIHFGPDSKLYVGVGENANGTNAQTLTNLLGKILRINADGSVPVDNPYYNQAPTRGEIYANGLRNPFTFAFHPTSGRLHINDVGQNTWEEIDLGARGVNYGWPTCEGVCMMAGFTDPIAVYNHNSGGAAIAGGAFYTAAAYPAAYSEAYFFGDYVLGFIKYVTPPTYGTATITPFGTALNSPVDIHLGPDGNLYYASIGGNSIIRIRYTGGTNRQPTAVASASPTAGPMPLMVSFSGSQSTDPDGDTLTYAWDFGDGNMGTGVAPTHTYMSPTPAGPKVVTLTVDDGKGQPNSTATTTLTVVPGDNPPTASIVTPSAPATYKALDTIAYSGTASDLDETLPPSAYAWTIVFHHNTHTHPFLGPITGVTSGMFQIPDMGEPATDVFYRIHLTVTDSLGASTDVFRDVTPQTVALTVQTSPANLLATVDGQPFPTPYTFPSVVNFQRTLGPVNPQTYAATCYELSAWSDGGAATHAVAAPAAPTTYTATYTPNGAPPSVTAPAAVTVTQTLCQ